jgi:hypothetical protein
MKAIISWNFIALGCTTTALFILGKTPALWFFHRMILHTLLCQVYLQWCTKFWSVWAQVAGLVYFRYTGGSIRYLIDDIATGKDFFKKNVAKKWDGVHTLNLIRVIPYHVVAFPIVYSIIFILFTVFGGYEPTFVSDAMLPWGQGELDWVVDLRCQNAITDEEYQEVVDQMSDDELLMSIEVRPIAQYTYYFFTFLVVVFVLLPCGIYEYTAYKKGK